MGGVLIDIAALAVIAGFAWAGYTLGFVRATIRLIGAIGAFFLAVLVREPVAKVVEVITPFENDFANLLGMLGVGIATFLALAALVTYYASWVPHERLRDLDHMLGAVPGAVLGICWVGVMVSLLVLTPSNTFYARGAIQSFTGGVMINGVPEGLRWFNEAFPHYTQTLPKGKLGAVTRSDDRELTLADAGERAEDPRAAGELLAYINGGRERQNVAPLTWNPEVAEAATRHSQAMFADRFFDSATPSGSRFSDRMKAGLGTSVSLYDLFATQVVWAHDMPSAYNALQRDAVAHDRVFDQRATEIGIGVVDGGWFNGAMITIGVLGRPPLSTDEQSEAATDAGGAGASTADDLDSVVEDAITGSG